MRLVTKNINCEIKYKKVKSSSISPQIVMKHNGQKVIKKQMNTVTGDKIEGYRWAYVTEEGKEVPAVEVSYFQVTADGSEVPTRPFDRTAEIKVIKEVPATTNNFLIHEIYELYFTSDNKGKGQSVINALYSEAERYIKEDIIGLALFSWGRGFKQYYAILQPEIVEANKFVWTMKLTETKIEYQHLMDIPTSPLIATHLRPPTVQTLPPIELLV